MITSFCLVTLKVELGVILSEEIRCWSLLGVNKLKRKRTLHEIVISVSLLITENIIFFIYHQELLFIWNGFKVLAHRPDLVPPLMKLVESSLHKLKQTKGKLCRPASFDL